MNLVKKVRHFVLLYRLKQSKIPHQLRRATVINAYAATNQTEFLRYQQNYVWSTSGLK